MGIFNPRNWKRFTSATDLMKWKPVNPDGYDEPTAVFDPLVWRQLLGAEERRAARVRTESRERLATG
jgi:hypothetical protein